MVFIPCYHPLKALRLNNHLVDGKPKILFVKSYDNVEDCLSVEKLSIPCGQCLGCRLEYARQWAIRCYFEAKQYEHNYFVTLTYDDVHLPIVPHAKVDKSTGEVTSLNDVATLYPRDLQLFLKRLRTNQKRDYGNDNVRFFACGEYGPQTNRPHYHLILFNCPLYDLKFEKNENGFTYYRSPFIEKTWGKGFVIVTDFSYSTAGYVARYMLKKHKGLDSSYYEENGLYPEFTRCSRKPGIGREYYELNKNNIYQTDEVFIPQKNGPPLKCKPPKYFDTIFELENPEQLEYTKCRRKETAMLNMEKQLAETDVDQKTYLEVKEGNKALSIRKLKRSV